MFTYYVMNESFNRKEIKPFNIFDNWVLDDAVQKEIKKYIRSPKQYHVKSSRNQTDIYGFDALCEEIRSLIKWQEWSRVEYEIIVKSLFDKNGETERKIDCYEQVEKNIPALTRELIWQYKQYLKTTEAKHNEQKS